MKEREGKLMLNSKETNQHSNVVHISCVPIIGNDRDIWSHIILIKAKRFSAQ